MSRRTSSRGREAQKGRSNGKKGRTGGKTMHKETVGKSSTASCHNRETPPPTCEPQSKLTVQPNPANDVKGTRTECSSPAHQACHPNPAPYSLTSQDYGQQMGRLEAQKASSRPGAPFSRQILVLPRRDPHCPPSIADYRSGYPTLKDNREQNANYMFYSGRAPFQPRGSTIDVILSNWKGKYDILESRHDYIQWLFPTRDGSRFNYHAQPLQKHEIEAICADQVASDRVLRSYRMMLDFYGMKLNQETGEVERNEGYVERFAVLNTSSHNYMRITRILKSLGELDYEYLKPPFVRFVLQEAIQSRLLDNTLYSCMRYWVETIRDENERDSLWLLAQKLSKSHV